METSTTGRDVAAEPGQRTYEDRTVAARRRQRDEFGGINWGSAFFGWLCAAGLAAILTGILAAAGAAIGLTRDAAASGPATVTLAGGIALVVVLLLAYYAGGYVAGRMSRFDGGRQGLGVWLWGIVITLALGVAGYAIGDQYNVLNARTSLPDLPIGSREATTGGIVASVVILLGTLLAAMTGGITGTRYHRRVDAAGAPADVSPEARPGRAV